MARNPQPGEPPKEDSKVQAPSENLKKYPGLTNAGKGRVKGVPNKNTAARQAVSDQLLDAWHEGNAQIKARQVVQAALDAAEDGDLSELNVILPYIARKQPDRIEFTPVEAMSPDEIEAIWGKRQDK